MWDCSGFVQRSLSLLFADRILMSHGEEEEVRWVQNGRVPAGRTGGAGCVAW